MGLEEHWDSIYRTKNTEDLGWYEPLPSTLDLVQRFSAPSDPVIDIGGGDSRMVDELTRAGYSDLTVLDLSDSALTRARSRLGSAGRSVTWIRTDVTRWEPTRTWALWHDRAVFHFLTAEEDRRSYNSEQELHGCRKSQNRDAMEYCKRSKGFPPVQERFVRKEISNQIVRKDDDSDIEKIIADQNGCK